jgi:VIT1/CCC1 family predicted Fe2+/Mn2+ transporter
VTLIGLAFLGWLSAYLGGAKVFPAIVRVVIWGVVALVTTNLIGEMFGVKTG